MNVFQRMSKVLRTATLLLCFVAIGSAVVSCKKESLKDLSAQLVEGATFEIRQGETLQIPFYVAEVNEYEVTAEATSSNELFPVTVKMVPGVDGRAAVSGVITMTAPELIFAPTSVNVTLKVNDPTNLRETSSVIPVEVKMAENYMEITEPANCFVVKPGAMVKFPANIGNTKTAASFTTAELVWQDAKGLVERIIPVPEEKSVIVVLKSGVSGNALISVINTNEITWSYHLWVTDFNPDANVMTWTGTDNVTYKIMDRYVGATSTNPKEVTSNGLFYQWGRKDPFPASNHSAGLCSVYNIENEEVTPNIEPCSQSNNIANSILHPFTHYSGVSGGNYSWITNAKANIPVAELADMWGAISKTHTQYDPCPAGWRVIPTEAWTFIKGAGVTEEKVYSVDTAPANKDMLGRYYSADGANKFYFPSQGEVPHGGKLSSSIGTTWPCGKAWSSTVDEANFRAWATSVSPSSISPKGGIGFGYELPIRCIKL